MEISGQFVAVILSICHVGPRIHTWVIRRPDNVFLYLLRHFAGCPEMCYLNALLHFHCRINHNERLEFLGDAVVEFLTR